MLALNLALFLAAAAPQVSLESPCGVSQSRQLIAFNAYADKSSHTVQVDQTLAIEIRRQEHGPIAIRRAPDGDVLYEMAEREFDGFMHDSSEIPDSPRIKVVDVATDHGSLIIDPSSTLKKLGAWIFLCWKPRDQARSKIEAHRETYSGTETDASTGEVSIQRTDGSKITLPTLRNQVEIEKIQISADGRRIGWLVDEPNCCTSYPVPVHLVIFKAGKIEKLFDDELCIFDWTFARNGKAVSYWISALHGTDFERFRLRDISTGRHLAEYDYPDSFGGGSAGGEARREAAIAAAPHWVKDTPSH